MNKKFIAYKGEKYLIEWYFDDRGKSPACEYFEELSKNQQEKLVYLFTMIGDTGAIRSEEKFNYENDKIYAFKPTPDRFLCFFYQGSKIIVTNAFEKKQQKLPPREKQKALKARSDYIKRCDGENYYE
jgi:phage-related protein